MEIYLCDMSKLNVKESYGKLLGQLEDDTRASIERFKFEQGRHTAFTREILLRYVFYKALGEGEVSLSKNSYGKPFITGVRPATGIAAGQKQDLNTSPTGDNDTVDFGKAPGQLPDFNITHSGDIVAVIFGKGRAGIDVERDERIKDYKSLLRFLYKNEIERIEKAADPRSEFCRIWTFREALSKEEGVGLSLFEREESAKNFLIEIDYDQKKVNMDGRELYFHEYDCPGYHLTCCTEKETPAPALICADAEMWAKMTAVFAKIDINVLN